jgi:hypothetical protein
MQISIKIDVPSQLKQASAAGLLLSYITSGIEVATGSRKASYFRHFWRERLSRTERRLLLVLLNNLIDDLAAKINKVPRALSESEIELTIPKEFAELIQSFQAI